MPEEDPKTVRGEKAECQSHQNPPRAQVPENMTYVYFASVMFLICCLPLSIVCTKPLSPLADQLSALSLLYVRYFPSNGANGKEH